MIALSIWGGTFAFTNEPFDWVIFLIVIISSIGLLGLFSYALVETILGRLIITENSISDKKAFGIVTIDFTDISGFRINDKGIYIFGTQNRKISFPIYIERYQEIEDWLSANFLNLDLHEAATEVTTVLQNDEFGITQQARESKLAEAKKVARLINIFGYISVAWLWFYPQPYSYAIVLSMVVPILGLISIFRYQGLIKLDEKKNSTLPSVIYGVYLPICGLGLRAVLDYTIIFDDNIWVVSASAAVAFVMILRLSTNELKFRKPLEIFLTLSVAILMFCYSISTYVIINCLFDKSIPDQFKTKVIDKEISSGKSTTYYVIVEPWGPITEQDKVSVTKDDYEAINIKQDVIMYLQQGLLKTKWYYVGKQ